MAREEDVRALQRQTTAGQTPCRCRLPWATTTTAVEGMKRFRVTLVLLAVVAGGLAAVPVRAQAPAVGRTVSVIADGEARAQPDIAVLTAGVEATEATPGEALTRVNEQIAGVIATLRRFGVAEDDIQTADLSLFSLVEGPDRPGGGPPGVIGYRATNTVSVTARDLARVNALIDALVSAGITTLSGLRFDVSDRDALHARALADAVAAARPLAEAAARAAGLTLGQIASIEEVGPGGDVAARQLGLGAAPGAAVQPGTLTLQVRVRVTFLVGG